MNNNQQKKKSGKRPKKYKFHGNQFTKKVIPAKRLSASSKKLENSFAPEIDTEFDGYCIIDKSICFKMIQECLSCKICGGNIIMKSEVVAGISERISIYCKKCGELSSCRNSCLKGKKGNIPEINHRLMYAMRALGQGLSGARLFCGLMDLPQPVTLNAYNSIIRKIKNATNVRAKESMSGAVKEEILLNNGLTDITISGDGTWKTRGHSSLVGVCTVIGASCGKVIDTEVLSSYCKGCDSFTESKCGKHFEEWKKEHMKVCVKNHSGSAAMMEVVGMQRIYERSEIISGVRYAEYIGDGDCKTFQAIQKSEPYGKDLVISKIECVGHVQKRMGTRLRKRKQELKGKKLDDKKNISGKGRLTEDAINKLTIYYGNAIREHCTSVKDMQKAIWAIFYHKRSTDTEPLHDFCPTGKDSWCPYQKASCAGTLESFKHQNTIPAAVMDAVKDIFKDLSMPSLLQRCLGGHTQNANESFNNLIWKMCPKTSGSGANIVQIAVNEAVVLYNNGQCGRLHTMKELGFKVGGNAGSFAVEVDANRTLQAEKRKAMSSLEARRAKKLTKLITEEDIKLREGTVYATGQF